MTRSRLQVIYIAGYGRSGSTILSAVLGVNSNTLAAGELLNVLAAFSGQYDSVTSNQEGDAYWQRVKQALNANFSYPLSRQDYGRFAQQQSLLEQFKNIFMLKLFITNEQFRQYSEVQQKLLSTIAKVSDRNIIIDSSKTAWKATWRPYLLNRSGVDVKVIHLVRNGRDVMYSMLKGSNRELAQEPKAKPKPIKQLLRVMTGWTMANLAAMLNGLLIGIKNYHVLSYEQFVSQPNNELQQLSQKLKIDCTEALRYIEQGLPFTAGVQFGGNRLLNATHFNLRANNTAGSVSPKRRSIYEIAYWLCLGWLHLLLYLLISKKIG